MTVVNFKRGLKVESLRLTNSIYDAVRTVNTEALPDLVLESARQTNTRLKVFDRKFFIEPHDSYRIGDWLLKIGDQFILMRDTTYRLIFDPPGGPVWPNEPRVPVVTGDWAPLTEDEIKARSIVAGDTDCPAEGECAPTFPCRCGWVARRCVEIGRNGVQAGEKAPTPFEPYRGNRYTL